MIYGWWAFWILCSHWRYPHFFFLHPTPLSRPLHVLSIARESNSNSLIACSYPCPDWLACFIKQDKEREKQVWKYFNNKPQTSHFFPSVQFCVMMNSKFWWKLSYTNTSLSVLPFSILGWRWMPGKQVMSGGSFRISFFIFSHHFYDTVTWVGKMGGIPVTLRRSKIEIYWFFLHCHWLYKNSLFNVINFLSRRR